ncbi:putative aggregation factor core protein MAFp3, isoform C [Acidisarcina polymorpha]|uniref:Putative aggregation factor core protein MAFp3, isoform C n=1 Tax=Acidisarcina polymorpha TaxID=2211140 RepID=A0A2Z5G330_9BACT|nr:FG-GAP-like repeat-containing protein [Acidisarcina polymorpha]AXC13623.1 putative aggregation factor core protein MAFp3, isoform C [Acidisarcina polymorpha]
MLRFLPAGARTAVTLITIGCSSIAFSQRQAQPAPLKTKTPPVTALQKRYQTPADQLMIPYLKAHGNSGSRVDAIHPNATSDVTVPNFGGYVNAPNFPARNTASLAAGIFDTGVTVELEADFNKDGKPDIAVMQEDGTLNILIGDGAGNLSAPTSYFNPNQATTNVLNANAVDVNGDGAVDIVAFDYINNAVITWLNLGNGQFNAAVTTLLDTTYGYAGQVYAADVNGDGKADLIYDTTIAQSNTSTTIALEVQLGAGDGTFGQSSAAKVQQLTIPASVSLFQAASMAMGDINGDGKIDLALGLPENTGSTGNLVVMTVLGNGDGTFSIFGATQAISAAALTGPFGPFFNSSGVSLADVNGDGKVDVLSELDGTLYVAPGNGDGTFGAPVTSSDAAIVGPASTVILDVNGDGKPDFVTAGGTLGILLGNGDGTFAAPTASNQYVIDPAGYNSLLAGDFNGDGKQDLALLGATYVQVSLFFGNGTNFPGAPVVTANNDPQAISTELVASGNYTKSGYQSPLFLYQNSTTFISQLYTGVNDGKGNFTSVQSLAGGLPSDLQYIQPIQADLNGDGLTDLAYATSTGDVLVALSKGDGTFGTPASIGIGTEACPVYYGAAGDINGDGKVDLVIPYGSDAACGSLSGGPSGYWVALGNGDGTFAKPVFMQFGTELYSLTLADINGDGKLDMLINDVPFVNGSGYQLSYAPGNGDGTFGQSSVIESSYVISNVATADINGDGKLDIVLSAEEVAGSDVTTGGIVTITGNGDGTFNLPSTVTMGDFFYGMQVADMNNDGIPDIVACLYETDGQPVENFGMVTYIGLGNGQFTGPYNQLQTLGSTLPLVGSFYDDNAMDVMTETGYGPALFIGQGGSSLALTSSGSLINFGDSTMLTATVKAGLAGRPAATGSISFYDGTTLLGTASLSSGAATYSPAALAIGTHTISAVYAGDTNYNPVTSASSSITVAALPPAFTLTGTPAKVTVTGGSQGVVTLNLTANASFSGAVTLSCSGMPTNGTCTVNPGSAMLTAGGSSVATLLIGTSATHAELQSVPSPWQVPATGASLAALCGVLFLRRRRLHISSALGLVALLWIGAFMAGCGGGGNPKNSSALTVTPGSYTITVSATPATGSTAAAQTTTVSLTVN